ncbi:MAG: four helix bundle protein [Bdellovibrionota bacterium]
MEFYQLIQSIEVKGHLRDQLIRAASSISLNLAEGNAKGTVNEKRHFFQTAYASLKECKTIFKLLKLDRGAFVEKADHLKASLYRLIHSDIKAFNTQKSDKI